jgi:hypothetical protein
VTAVEVIKSIGFWVFLPGEPAGVADNDQMRGKRREVMADGKV